MAVLSSGFVLYRTRCTIFYAEYSSSGETPNTPYFSRRNSFTSIGQHFESPHALETFSPKAYAESTNHCSHLRIRRGRPQFVLLLGAAAQFDVCSLVSTHFSHLLRARSNQMAQRALNWVKPKCGRYKRSFCLYSCTRNSVPDQLWHYKRLGVVTWAL